MTASQFLNWGIYQPVQADLIDFSGSNGHVDTNSGRNGIAHEWNESGNDVNGEVPISDSWNIQIEDFGLKTVYVDFACNERSSEWGIGTGSGTLTVTDSSGDVVSEGDCANNMMKLKPGDYGVAFSTLWTGVNSSYTLFAGVNVIAYQPLLI